MREVKVAKSAGFCFGVQRAVDMVYDEALKAAETGRKVYTLELCYTQRTSGV